MESSSLAKLAQVFGPQCHPEWKSTAIEFDCLIAFINAKSGGQKGLLVKKKFENHLKAQNIFDLGDDGGPRKGLELHKHKENLKIIACGGDGTVGWVLSVIDEVDFKQKPCVAILPLGTGNDLARTLGWGGGYNNESIYDFLIKVSRGQEMSLLDRWNIETSSKDIWLPLRVINNYFSFGADAKISLDFHHARESNPSAFANQTANKLEYAKIYGQDLLAQSCKDLLDSIDLFECDGVNKLDKLHKHPCHSLLILNIPSYASGQKPWLNEQGREQHIGDGKLEVLVFKTCDFLFLPVGGHGHRIAQPNRIRIRTRGELPIQIDGEPHRLAPCEILIEHRNQARMIVGSKEDRTDFFGCF